MKTNQVSVLGAHNKKELHLHEKVSVFIKKALTDIAFSEGVMNGPGREAPWM